MDKNILPDKEDNSNQLLKPINLTGSKLFLQIFKRLAILSFESIIFVLLLTEKLTKSFLAEHLLF